MKHEQEDCHTQTRRGEGKCKGDGVERNTRLPGAGAEPAHGANVRDDGGNGHHNAEADQRDARVHRKPGRMRAGIRPKPDLPQKEPEPRYGKADAHECEPGAQPRKKRPFRGEVDTRVVVRFGHVLYLIVPGRVVVR